MAWLSFCLSFLLGVYRDEVLGGHMSISQNIFKDVDYLTYNLISTFLCFFSLYSQSKASISYYYKREVEGRFNKEGTYVYLWLIHIDVWQKCWSCSRVQLFVTSWTIAQQAPLSLGFPRQEYGSGFSCPSFSRRSSWPRDWTQVSHIPGRFFIIWATREAPYCRNNIIL